MPLDDMDIARLRAEMLRRAEQPTYDDGASQLGQDPNMLRVGLFGRGPKPTAPINPSRRSLFGLPEAPVAQPIVPVTPQQPAPTAPQPAVTPTAPQSAVAPTQPANPLGQLAQQALNAPVSRRQVLKRAGAAAIQSALPMPSATDVAKEVLSPLAEAAVSAPFDKAAAINAIADYAASIYEDPKAAATAFKLINGENVQDYWDGMNPEEIPIGSIWDEMRHSDDDTSNVAKAIGLDAATIAKNTNLPLNDVISVLGNSEGLALDNIISPASRHSNHQQILEDGRGKEARRSTNYIDIWNDTKFLKSTAKQILKEYGRNADAYDLYDAFNNALFERWKDMERGNTSYNAKTGLTTYAQKNNELQNAMAQRIIDDGLLEETWSQASEDDDTYEAVLEIFQKAGWRGEE